MTLPGADTRSVWELDGTGATPGLKGKWEATDALSVTWTQDGGSTLSCTKFVVDVISADGKTATFKQASELASTEARFSFEGDAAVGVYYPYKEVEDGWKFPRMLLNSSSEVYNYGAGTLGSYTVLGAAALEAKDGVITSAIELAPISSFMRVPSGRDLVATEDEYDLGNSYVDLSSVNNICYYRPTYIDITSQTGVTHTNADLSAIVTYDSDTHVYSTTADLFIPFFPPTDEVTPKLRLLATSIEWTLPKQTYVAGKLYTISEETMGKITVTP